MVRPVPLSVPSSGGRIPSLRLLAALAASSLLLASCSSGSGPARSGGGELLPSAASERRAATGDAVAVDYVLRADGGAVFDTTIASEAAGSAKHDPKRAYSPLVLVLGEGKHPEGFEAGIAGMAVGERKVFSVPPEKGYGTAEAEVRMAKRLLEDSYAETVSRKTYADSFETVVPDNAFAESGKPVPKAGDRISSGGVESEVLKVSGGLVTLRVENRNNPFYGRELAVGLKGKREDGSTVEITALDRDNATVKVANASNPFKGKKLETGTSAMIGGELHTVRKVEGDAVVLTKGHELAGKTLEYEVMLRAINP